MRESMQVTIATPAFATPSKPAYSKESAKVRLASRRSSKPAEVGCVSAMARNLADDGHPGRGVSAVTCGTCVGAAQQHQGQDRGQQRAPRGAQEDGLLLGD